MILDAGHRRWAWGSVAALAAGVAAYAALRPREPAGHWGGTAPGIAFGVAAGLLMLFAWLLAGRKRVPTWRLGPVRWWMKGHIWLGLLSLPAVLLHGDFRIGGTVTTVLMVLFGIVFASGLVGLALQQFLPRMLLEQVPMETVYEEIPRVLGLLRDEADALVARCCGPSGLEFEGGDDGGAGGASRIRPRSLAASRRPPAPSATDLEEPLPGHERLREEYLGTIRPFLRAPGRPGGPLALARQAGPYFEALRLRLPEPLHEPVRDLENICEERRQLALQARLHHWLHGWLIAHVPLSMALMILTVAHAVTALRY